MPSPDLVISGIIDGGLLGGLPKAVEFTAQVAIPDLSIYGFGSANNGEGTDGIEFTFPNDAVAAGTHIWVATESTNFNAFFGYPPTYTNADAPNINGNDAIELFKNSVVIDVFGDITYSPGTPIWNYEDGWAYRINQTGPDPTFVFNNWVCKPGVLDNVTSNATATDPAPFGSYIYNISSVICVFPGALVNTINGHKKIEDLMKNDILFDDQGYPVELINNVKCPGSFKGYTMFYKDCFAPNVPSFDLIITDGHPIRVPNSDREIAVEHLANNQNIIHKEGPIPETYSLITKKRIFIPINNIPVCTWAEHKFKQYAINEKLEYTLL